MLARRQKSTTFGQQTTNRVRHGESVITGVTVTATQCSQSWVLNADWNNFRVKWEQLSQQGLRLVDIETYVFQRHAALGRSVACRHRRSLSVDERRLEQLSVKVAAVVSAGSATDPIQAVQHRRQLALCRDLVARRRRLLPLGQPELGHLRLPNGSSSRHRICGIVETEEEPSLVRAMVATSGGHGYVPPSAEAGAAVGDGGDGPPRRYLPSGTSPRPWVLAVVQSTFRRQGCPFPRSPERVGLRALTALPRSRRFKSRSAA